MKPLTSIVSLLFFNILKVKVIIYLSQVIDFVKYEQVLLKSNELMYFINKTVTCMY